MNSILLYSNNYNVSRCMAQLETSLRTGTRKHSTHTCMNAHAHTCAHVWTHTYFATRAHMPPGAQRADTQTRMSLCNILVFGVDAMTNM